MLVYASVSARDLVASTNWACNVILASTMPNRHVHNPQSLHKLRNVLIGEGEQAEQRNSWTWSSMGLKRAGRRPG